MVGTEMKMSALDIAVYVMTAMINITNDVTRNTNHGVMNNYLIRGNL